MDNNNQTNSNKKANPGVLIILVIVIIAIIGYGVWQSTNKKDSKQDETTTVSTTAETTETTTESTTQTTTATTESTTKKREVDNKMLEFLSHSQWDNSFDDSLFISNGTIEYFDSNDNLQDTMLLSIYARTDNKYDVEIQYKNGKTETYIMSTDFSYDGEYLHYDCYTYTSYITLQGNGELAGKWMFKGNYG